jgi:hypothetical protein
VTRALVGAALALGCGLFTACGHSSPAPSAATTTTIVHTPTTAAPRSSLLVTGVSPGVEQAPFYPATTVTYVACGPVPGGNFVDFIVPGGSTPGYTSSALASPTAVIVVPGEAVLIDRTGKTLYEQKLSGITTGTQGALVLSMPNATYTGGSGQPVEAGAVNVSGTFTCATTNTKYPGL